MTLTPAQFKETAEFLDEEVPGWQEMSADEIKKVLFTKVDESLDLYLDLTRGS